MEETQTDLDAVVALLGLLWLAVTLVVAAVVYASASKAGARRGRLGGGLLDMGPAGWFFTVLVFGPWAGWLWACVRPSLWLATRIDAGELGGQGRSWRCSRCGRTNPASNRYCGDDGVPRDSDSLSAVWAPPTRPGTP